VGDIEKTRARAGSFVLEDYAFGVGNRHVPSVKIHEPRAMSLVPIQTKSVPHFIPLDSIFRSSAFGLKRSYDNTAGKTLKQKANPISPQSTQSTQGLKIFDCFNRRQS
jgi:hypothetical protein